MTPAEVSLRDVTLRDGLQDEATIPTDAKLTIYEALVAAGITQLELTSFVRPDQVPAMADAEAMCRSTAGGAVTRWGLTLNERGIRRAIDVGLRHLQYVVSVSDTHSRRNAGASTEDAMTALPPIIELADSAGAVVELTLATAWGCPYEHRVAPDRVARFAELGQDAGVSAIGLADTIGVAIPSEVTVLVGLVGRATDLDVGVHLHDTRGLGVANALAGIDAGVRRVDGSVGGLGGCPFAPGASGNLALEDLAHVLEESGVATGVSVTGLIEAAHLACNAVGRPVTSHVGQAGARFADVHVAAR